MSQFRTSTTHGLTAAIIPSLRLTHGYNEFSVSAPEPPLLKFAKMFYESPLILLLCGSAFISAIMGNVEDATSITIAIIIVLTGPYFLLAHTQLLESNLLPLQSASYRNDAQSSPLKRSTSSFPTIATLFATESQFTSSPTSLSQVTSLPSPGATASPLTCACSPRSILRLTRAA